MSRIERSGGHSSETGESDAFIVATRDTEGIRALYGTFSPIARLEEARREEILDGVAHIAEREFGGRV